MLIRIKKNWNDPRVYAIHKICCVWVMSSARVSTLHVGLKKFWAYLFVLYYYY